MKKQILTFVALATIAVGAAIASTSNGEFTAKPEGQPGDCTENVECHPSLVPNCVIDDQSYVGRSGIGMCEQTLAED